VALLGDEAGAAGTEAGVATEIVEGETRAGTTARTLISTAESGEGAALSEAGAEGPKLLPPGQERLALPPGNEQALLGEASPRPARFYADAGGGVLDSESGLGNLNRVGEQGPIELGPGEDTVPEPEASKAADTVDESPGIPKSEYDKLRKKSPSRAIQRGVNSAEGPRFDPIYGYEVDTLEADHIMSMKEITQVPDFAKLTFRQKLDILNLPENFMGLGKRTNASKGAKSWEEWSGHSELGPIPTQVREAMLGRSAAARKAILEAIRKTLEGSGK
jgi:hypothetical protein